MSTPVQLAEQMTGKTNDELLAILNAPAEWTPEALAAARAELDGREVRPVAAAEAKPEPAWPPEDINQQILVELRKLRRSSEIGSFFALAALAILVGYIFLRLRPALQRSRSEQQVEQARQQESARLNQPSRTSSSDSQPSPWEEVSRAMNRFDYPKAITLLRDLIARQPTYYYGYSYLGSVYLTMGELTNSEAHHLRAWELLPDEENEKALAVVRKRIARELGVQKPPK